MTRQERARKLLISEGFNSAAELPDAAFVRSDLRVRNRSIVQAVIFGGQSLRAAALDHGLSVERVRQVGLRPIFNLKIAGWENVYPPHTTIDEYWAKRRRTQTH